MGDSTQSESYGASPPIPGERIPLPSRASIQYFPVEFRVGDRRITAQRAEVQVEGDKSISIAPDPDNPKGTLFVAVYEKAESPGEEDKMVCEDMAISNDRELSLDVQRDLSSIALGLSVSIQHVPPGEIVGDYLDSLRVLREMGQTESLSTAKGLKQARTIITREIARGNAGRLKKQQAILAATIKEKVGIK